MSSRLAGAAAKASNRSTSAWDVIIGSNAFIGSADSITTAKRVGNSDNSNYFQGHQSCSLSSEASAVPSPSHYLGSAAVKDNLSTLRRSTTCASGILANYNSPYEASVIQCLRDNGGTVFGKTNMDEFGMGSHSTNSAFGPVKNRQTFSAGGSSGGSAVAVSTDMTELGIGTDTGGSVRLPAAYNGITGFKPSYGRISRFGVIPYANSLDTVGLFTRDCSKMVETFNRLRHHDSQDPTSTSQQTIDRLDHALSEATTKANHLRTRPSDILRIGVPIEYNIEELHQDVRGAWKAVLETLRSQGHDIVPVSLPSTRHALPAYYILAAAEAASNLAKYDGVRYGTRRHANDGEGGVLYAKTRGDGFGDEVKRRILLGSYTLSSEAIDNYFIQAQKVRRLVQRDFDRVFSMPNPLQTAQQFDLSEIEEYVELENKLGPAQIDVIVCPTTPTTAPLLSDVMKQTSVDAYMNDVFTVPASLAGLPAISIPASLPEDYCKAGELNKAGIQVIGQYWTDDLVLSVARMIEGCMNGEKDLVSAALENEIP
ncbi:MAG: Trimeric GatFAB AmidoTransferase(AdT) complex subunit [Claussenomyces sp. TS43310]|nr:MAG: Trimeric GatFAB AmidoTransferase(AdT) complex subunit [Claussenomyces sp. TS43310]